MPQRSSVVAIGDLLVGGNHPLVVQSMTNTNTLDTEATVKQAEQLYRAGCQMIRITAQGVREAENLAAIKKELQTRGIRIPLIADIHFQPKAAEVAARIVEKVRINPGNYVDRCRNKKKCSEKEYGIELEKIADRLYPLVKICKEYGTAIRVGTNHGSLSERILYKYGNTAEGMVASTLEFVEIFRQMNFHHLVLSLKASAVKVMVKSNRLWVKEMLIRNYYYPLHLGVTEAGAGEAARVKSAAGIGSLLATGIGDTLRVSLTEDPVKEIPFAIKLASLYAKERFSEKMPVTQPELFAIDRTTSQKLEKRFPLVLTTKPSEKADFYLQEDAFKSKTGENLVLHSAKIPNPHAIMKFSYSGISKDELLIRASTDVALTLEKKEITGIYLDNKSKTSADKCASLSMEILQALGLRYSKTEFIACPSCGRTQFDIMSQLKKVQSAIPNMKSLKIAVMGCVVNGIGEMADADYGYVGTASGKITLYKGKEIALKNIPENEAVGTLVQLIKNNGDWVSE